MSNSLAQLKAETKQLLEKFHSSKRFRFLDTEKGLEFEHDLTDEEKLELVTAEYGEKLTSGVDELFVVIVKKLVQLTVEKAKELFADKLSEL
jgi:hypothetical protein